MKYVVQVGDRRFEVDVDGEDVSHLGERVAARLEDVAGTPVHLVTIGARVYRVAVRKADGRGRYTLWIGGWRFDVEALDERSRAIRDLSAAAARDTGPRPLVAPMPGLIVRVAVAEGDTVVVGQALVVMEAMKMENELRAASAGVVRSVRVQSGMAVEKGTVLVELDR